MSQSIKDFFFEIGDLAKFTGSFFKALFSKPFEFNEFLKQAYEIGYKSIGLVGITGFILGLVLTLQTRPVLMDFGAEAWLPGMISLSIVREIGPVITALICAGKISSRIGAELGSMQVTEQIDAMEVSGTNPTKYLVTTRVLATTLMVPILVIYSDAIAIFASYLAANIEGNISFHLFFIEAFDNLNFQDLFPAIIKTFFFGFGIGIIGCYKGYRTQKGTEGVGLAANSAVVLASIAIFVIDLIAVQLQLIINIF
ncbi:MAG: ABC transporter permease [Bacteroidota bacterium]|nr:ABC transporter permease [Bacteroidota bacterium]